MFEEPRKQGKGKKGSVLPWLIGGAGIVGYFWYRTKKKQAEAQAARRREELRQEQEKAGPGEVPGSTLNLPLEGHFSAAERLRALGDRPGNSRQPGDPYRG